jgi:hypothetical protein
MKALLLLDQNGYPKSPQDLAVGALFPPILTLPLERLCRNPFMVRQAHHERITIALKFSDSAVRPEPVEGLPLDYDTVSEGGGEGGGDRRRISFSNE